MGDGSGAERELDGADFREPGGGVQRLSRERVQPGGERDAVRCGVRDAEVQGCADTQDGGVAGAGGSEERICQSDCSMIF